MPTSGSSCLCLGLTAGNTQPVVPQEPCSGSLIRALVCDGIQGFLLPTAVLDGNVASRAAQFQTVNSDSRRRRQMDGRLEVLWLIISDSFGPRPTVAAVPLFFAKK